MATMQVDLVSPEAKIWSGEAEYVGAVTIEGSIGILPGHIPYLAELATGVLTIRPSNGSEVHAAVHGGFLSVSDAGVQVLAEVAELAADIDVQRAQQALSRAEGTTGALEDESVQAVRRAQTRIAAAAN